MIVERRFNLRHVNHLPDAVAADRSGSPTMPSRATEAALIDHGLGRRSTDVL